jgi:hypothetical protein
VSERLLLPDLSLSFFERTFPRTCLCLTPAERSKVARELTKLGETRGMWRLPEKLEGRKWENSRGFVADLARLELALRSATIAPEIESRGFELVPAAEEPQWYEAKFRFDPAHRILESDWPLEEVYAHPDSDHARAPGTFLIFRTGGKAHFRALGPNESLLIRSLSLGVTLGKVLERNGGPDFDARTFHRWMESGLLRAIDWAAV